MSLFNHTVWGNVSIEVVKMTDSWKKAESTTGITGDNYRTAVAQGLVELGMDTKKLKFTEEKANIRCDKRKDVVCHTTVFRFAVKDNYRYKAVYERNKSEIVHVDNGEIIYGVDYTHLDNFGNVEQPVVRSAKDELEEIIL